MRDEATKSDTPAPKAEPESRLTDAELSRIAREAVHQPADARLDKQLVRLGVIDAPEADVVQPATPASTPSGAAAEADLERLRADYERLREDLGRSMMLVRVLIGILVVLAIVVVVLLIR
ncbi:MAG TPA: hypothetical protein VF119_01605 [Candidatus Limnocylindrales bacterium]